jgi:hypothetical protein
VIEAGTRREGDVTSVFAHGYRNLFRRCSDFLLLRSEHAKKSAATPAHEHLAAGPRGETIPAMSSSATSDLHEGDVSSSPEDRERTERS